METYGIPLFFIACLLAALWEHLRQVRASSLKRAISQITEGTRIRYKHRPLPQYFEGEVLAVLRGERGEREDVTGYYVTEEWGPSYTYAHEIAPEDILAVLKHKKASVKTRLSIPMLC
ncbi:MAG: hypothetical protein A3A33_03780 [Candidatus Yanofskybacteria bacterium RIFCSPLOWO2_01_FULL_49_25]|uniref:Uncharacterized protein n=1 Tax=Candidatus Yanofskybacteria bacterium RIFCSPLOWO2_01_FULL_49_25 TaxID=1802701 RepID=A0A1F8GXB4_9BACT|nr:MAG: hypothetical protein A3A33_03780 [Candidatus Yanofskybacteria bacterium RIFCSPLOWO2_01_FULL_49_25]